MSHWWRAHNKSVNNRKLQKLPGDLFKGWYNVNCLASANDGVVPAIEDVAFALRISEQRAAALLTQLFSAKMLDRREDGSFVPHDWDEHQYKTDKADPTGAERQKRYRDKRRNARDVTLRNGSDAVLPKRPEAESETDTEQSRADAPAPIDEDLEKRAAGLRAGITALFASRGVDVPASLYRCQLWLEQGYAAGTVLAAVETVLKRGKTVTALEYFDGAIGDAHAKTAAQPMLQVVPSKPKVWVDEGTPEFNAHVSESFRLKGRGIPVTDHKDDNGHRTGRRGWWMDSLWPAGFNDFGERIQSNEDAA